MKGSVHNVECKALDAGRYSLTNDQHWVNVSFIGDKGTAHNVSRVRCWTAFILISKSMSPLTSDKTTDQ